MTIQRGIALLAVCGLFVAVNGCGGGSATPPPADPSSAGAGSGASSVGNTASDKDGDGIPDGTDKCPDQKEDGQPPDPKDGCPKT